MLRLVGTLFLLQSAMQFQASDNAIGALLYAGVAILIFLTASLRYRYGA